MKKIFLLFYLIYNLGLLAQTNKLNVTISDCRKGLYSMEHGFGEFSLYKDDSLYGEYNIYKNPSIDSLPNGKYYIEYETFYGKRKSESQQIDKDSFFPYFDVCVDELPDDLRKTTTNLFMDNLNEGDEVSINRQYSGCFNFSKTDSLVVKVKDNKCYLIFKKKKYRLNQEQIDILRDFEIQMRNVKESGMYSTAWCNTYIQNKHNVISFGSPMGDWECYEYLLIQLGFLKREKSPYFKGL